MKVHHGELATAWLEKNEVQYVGAWFIRIVNILPSMDISPFLAATM